MFLVWKILQVRRYFHDILKKLPSNALLVYKMYTKIKIFNLNISKINLSKQKFKTSFASFIF